MVEKLSLIDRRILYELDLNARIPTTKLARKLRISRERADYRINNLIKNGVIRKFVCMVNPAKLGYSTYKIYFKFQNMSKEKEKEAIEWLVNNNFVAWIASSQGRWDLNLTVFAKDINHFDEILSKFILKFGEYIFEQEVNTTLYVAIMSKDWLLPEKKLTSRVSEIGGKIKDLKIDKTDVEILKILANNGRMNSTEIAEKIKSTPRTVIYRMRQLEKSGIILGYTTSLNLEVINMQYFKATINFSILSKKNKEEIIHFCRNHPHIGFFIFCVGSWPLEIELIIKDNNQFYGIMEEFRQKFNLSRTYGTLIFPKEYKFDWMPLCYRAQD